MDTFTTIRSEAHIEFTEKKSVFMGHAFPVSDEDSCLLYIDEMRSRYADATHNVYAYVLRQNNLMRYSDAGEPQGTAGMPTLDVLRKKGITDALVVVTRYFGGILLGAGGLVRAYSKAASDAVEAAGVVLMKPHSLLELTCRYNEYERIKNLTELIGAVEKSSEFSADIRMTLSIDSLLVGQLEKQLLDITNGRCIPRLLGAVYGETPLG